MERRDSTPDGRREKAAARVATGVATWAGAGLLPGAPGTWGSLAALPFVWGAYALAGPWGPALFAVAVAAAGLWAADRHDRTAARHDPGEIVVDEVAGQALTLALVAPDAAVYAAGFALFRLLDIVKPWPVSWADRRIGGGLGVMADDLIAGAIAAPGVWLFARWWGGMG